MIAVQGRDNLFDVGRADDLLPDSRPEDGNIPRTLRRDNRALPSRQGNRKPSRAGGGWRLRLRRLSSWLLRLGSWLLRRLSSWLRRLDGWLLRRVLDRMSRLGSWAAGCCGCG